MCPILFLVDDIYHNMMLAFIARFVSITETSQDYSVIVEEEALSCKNGICLNSLISTLYKLISIINA